MAQGVDDLSLLRTIVGALPFASRVTVDIDSLLSGGVVSVVGKGTYHQDGVSTPVAIKHTKSDIALNDKFSPLESRNILKFAASSQQVDAQILTHFQHHAHIKVPEVVAYFERERVTILRDFTYDGYELFQDVIVRGLTASDVSLFATIGTTLAYLRSEMAHMHHVKGVENKELQIEERTDELRVSLYDGRMRYYNQVHSQLLDRARSTFTWTDGHPKNMAVNKAGNVIMFDFGRSIPCDPEYPVANFLGQIYLFGLTGSVAPKEVVRFTETLLDAYRKTYTQLASTPTNLHEQNLVWYISAELAHRGKTMRWIDPKLVKIDETRAKLAVDHFIDHVFNKLHPITTLIDFEHAFLQIAEHLHDKDDTYLRPSISSLSS